MWGFVLSPCFVIQNCVSVQVLQSSHWSRETWLLYFICFCRRVYIIVSCIFLLVPWVGLWSVNVAFPSNTHLLFQDLCSSLEPYDVIWEIAELPLCLVPLLIFSSRLSFSKYQQSDKHFGSRSGLTFCRAWFGSKLFAKIISRRNMQVNWIVLGYQVFEYILRTT